MRAVNLRWDINHEDDLRPLPLWIEIPDRIKHDKGRVANWLDAEARSCYDRRLKGYTLVED